MESKNKISKIDLLLEELKDINKSPHNIHYTNIFNIVDILKDGFLKGRKYWHSNYGDYQEIATIRRSEDKRLGSIRKKKRTRIQY